MFVELNGAIANGAMQDSGGGKTKIEPPSHSQRDVDSGEGTGTGRDD